MNPDMKRIGCNDLPAVGSVERVAFLRRMRSAAELPVLPWVEAIEVGGVAAEADLLRVLGPHLDATAALRLLDHGLRLARGGRLEPVLLETAGGLRDPRLACGLRQQLDPLPELPIATLLLPLLGHQRDRRDFPLLQRLTIEPGPLSLRRAALEGLARGLSCWPEPDLAASLETLSVDLDPTLASTAVDLLARLPTGSAVLGRLTQVHLDPQVRIRVERRLRGWRSGGG